MKVRASLAALAAVMLVSVGGAHAQTATFAVPNLDTIPEKLPFNLPYGAPIGLDRARTVIDAAIAECTKRGWPMNVAVVDSGNNLVAFGRMDGAQLSSIEISQHKAHTALTYRRETKAFETAINTGTISQITLDGVVASRGGIPLVEGGKIIGAVGASGGAGSQDEVCAKAGASVINH